MQRPRPEHLHGSLKRFAQAFSDGVDLHVKQNARHIFVLRQEIAVRLCDVQLFVEVCHCAGMTSTILIPSHSHEVIPIPIPIPIYS